MSRRRRESTPANGEDEGATCRLGERHKARNNERRTKDGGRERVAQSWTMTMMTSDRQGSRGTLREATRDADMDDCGLKADDDDDDARTGRKSASAL